MIEKSRVQSVVFPANGHLIRERVSGGYLLKIARLPTSLPVQCCTTGKLTSSDPIVVMSRGIGPWPFVPQSCMTGATPSFTMSLSSSLREGYSAKRPMTLTGVWGVLFALNAQPQEVNLPLFIPYANQGKSKIVNFYERASVLTARYPKNAMEQCILDLCCHLTGNGNRPFLPCRTEQRRQR
jgi:hypothetical protein